MYQAMYQDCTGQLAIGNWVPPPVTAPSTTSSGTTGQDPSVIDETNDPDGTKAAAKTVPAGPE